MSDVFVVPDGKLDDWLAVLKPYQRTSIDALLKMNMSPEQVAENWIGSTGSANITNFGGVPDTKPFWESFKAEFFRFVCDNTTYVNYKIDLSKLSGEAKAVIVAAVSSAIGAQIGMVATLLIPAVALLLSVVSAMGRNAFCAMH